MTSCPAAGRLLLLGFSLSRTLDSLWVTGLVTVSQYMCVIVSGSFPGGVGQRRTRGEEQSEHEQSWRRPERLCPLLSL